MFQFDIRGLRAAFLVAVVCGLLVPSSASALVYWGNGYDDSVGRAENDGTHVEQTFLNTTWAPSGVAVRADHLYYTTPFGALIRANLDGSHQVQLVDGSHYAGASALAVDGSHIYWTGYNSIGRADLDGSNVNSSLVTGIKTACGLAVDAGHVYWGEEDGNTVGRANLDGSSPDHSFITTPFGPCGVAADSSFVYWTNYWDGGTSIGRANLNGTSPNSNFITGANMPCGLALDGSHIYWANRGSGTIGRANTDGTAVNNSLVSSAFPCPVAADNLSGTTTAWNPSDPIVYGEPLPLSADVAKDAGTGTPTGSVSFEDMSGCGFAPLGMSFPDCGLALGNAPVDGSGNATFLLGGPADVGRAYRAFYAGGSGLAPSDSAQVTPSITPATTGILAQVSPAQPVVGDVIYIVIQVGNLDTDVVPFGSVSLSILNTSVYATAELDADGLAAFALTGAPAGTYTGRVDYYDDTGPLRGSYGYSLPPDFQPSEAIGTITVMPNPATATGTAPPPPRPPTAQPVSPPKATPIVDAAALTSIARAEADVLHRRGLAAAARRSQTFTAAVAGTLRETITAAGTRTAKVTLLASGRHAYTAAGPGRVRLQLTAAGRRAATRKSVRRATVTVQFTPLQGSAVSVSRTVKLPRR